MSAEAQSNRAVPEWSEVGIVYSPSGEPLGYLGVRLRRHISRYLFAADDERHQLQEIYLRKGRWVYDGNPDLLAGMPFWEPAREEATP